MLAFLALAIENAEPDVHFGAGRNDSGSTEQMAQRALQVALAFQQGGQPHVRLEVAGFATDQLTVNRECLKRIFFRDAARFFEPFAHAGRTEAVLDLSCGALQAKVEHQLSGLGFDQHSVVADDDSAVIIDELERGNGALGIDELTHAPEASLQRLEMAACAQEVFGQAHHEQVVEREAKITAGRTRWINELSSDPITDSVRRNREDS